MCNFHNNQPFHDTQIQTHKSIFIISMIRQWHIDDGKSMLVHLQCSPWKVCWSEVLLKLVHMSKENMSPSRRSSFNPTHCLVVLPDVRLCCLLSMGLKNLWYEGNKLHMFQNWIKLADSQPLPLHIQLWSIISSNFMLISLQLKTQFPYLGDCMKGTTCIMEFIFLTVRLWKLQIYLTVILVEVF